MAIDQEVLKSTSGRKRHRDEADGEVSEGPTSYSAAKVKDLAASKPSRASMSDSDTSLSDPDETEAEDGEDDGDDLSASRNAGLKGEPASSDEEEGDTVVPDGVAAVDCLWDGCKKIFTELNTLIDHLHNSE